MDSDIVVEDLRGPYESSTEWKFRRMFLEAHKDKYPLDRLVCLANCFLNVEMNGCRYPQLVMEELKQLTDSLPQGEMKNRSKVKGNMKISFVKASEDLSQPSVCPASSSRPQPENTGNYDNRGFMNFVKSDSEFHSIDVSIKQQNDKKRKASQNKGRDEVSKPKSLKLGGRKLQEELSHFSERQEQEDMSEKFHFLARQIKLTSDPSRNAIEIIHQAAAKVKMTVACKIDACMSNTTGGSSFVCFVLIDFVEIAMGAGSNKKTAKHNAFTKTLEKLSHQYFRVFDIGPDKKGLEASDQPYEKSDLLEDDDDEEEEEEEEELSDNEEEILCNEKYLSVHKNTMMHNLNNFLILESHVVPNAASVLRQSADFNKALMKYISKSKLCTVFLCGQKLAVASGETKRIAKHQACEKALEKLRHFCWTIKIKHPDDSDAPEVSKADVMGEVQKELERIPDSNIGNQLLRKMGWSGGGVGKEGRKGIADPVTVAQVINREGLGSNSEKGIHVDFLSKVRSVILNYTKSCEQKDMVFASDFTKDERAIIHRESKKYGLKSSSRGQGEDRYLTVGRKRTPNQLFEHIAQNGGSTEKYQLIPPLTEQD